MLLLALQDLLDAASVGAHLHMATLVELLLHMVPLHMLPLLPGQLMLVPMSLMMKSMPHMAAEAMWGIAAPLSL